MDRRTKYTISSIKETFLNLLEEKEINKITVSEICTITDINRATFYRYYEDVYDLLEKIKIDFINEIKNSPVNNTHTAFSFSKELLEIFLENKKLVKILFDTNKNIYFIDEVLEVAYNVCKSKWLSENQDLEDEQIKYASIFIFNGGLGIINYWVKTDFEESVEYISKTIEALGLYGTKKYISDK